LLFQYKEENFLSLFLPYIIFASLGYIIIMFIFSEARRTTKRMILSCVGVGAEDDERRREITEEKKKELSRRSDRLCFSGLLLGAAGIVFSALIPFFEAAWMARFALAIISILFSYSLKSDISAEAEKAL
ncbi:MAG: hypothetical protein ACI4QR_07285, partial [Eubacteriales bacterium]